MTLLKSFPKVFKRCCGILACHDDSRLVLTISEHLGWYKGGWVADGWKTFHIELHVRKVFKSWQTSIGTNVLRLANSDGVTPPLNDMVGTHPCEVLKELNGNGDSMYSCHAPTRTYIKVLRRIYHYAAGHGWRRDTCFETSHLQAENQ